MTKKSLIYLSILALLFPLVIICAVYLLFSINIFDNPDFWYGYMAYFGTVVLAAVALWQNIVFKDENDTAQKKLENINKHANEINIINKIIEFENARIQNLYKFLDEFEKACHHNNIAIALHGCINQKIAITQATERCDFLFLSVSRELRVDRRKCEIKDELFELCSNLYDAAVNLLKAYDTESHTVQTRKEELAEIWKAYFITKEKYINSVLSDFQRLLYENLSLEEIRKIYYQKSEDINHGQTQDALTE